MKEKEAILQVAMGCLKLAHIDYEQSPLRCVWKSEKSQKSSVNWYSHGARYYDPQLALWHSSDPLSELYTSFSPYNYVTNNPVNFIDPNGMSVGKGPSAEERQKIKEGVTHGSWSWNPTRVPFANAFSFMQASGGWYYDDNTQTYSNFFGGSQMSASEFNSQMSINLPSDFNGELYTYSPWFQSTGGKGLETTQGEFRGFMLTGVYNYSTFGGNMTMDDVAAAIQEGGVDTFKEFLKHPEYGPDFFINSIEEQQTRNSERKLIPNHVKFAFKSASWGQEYFPNPDYDVLRHIIASFLIAEKYGGYNARSITNKNEWYGFIRLDIPNLRSRLAGSSPWALERQDLINNRAGISLWWSYSWWKNGIIDEF